MTQLPSILKKQREKLQLTQEAVAEAIGKGLRTYIAYEKGENTPKPPTLIKLSEVLQFDLKSIYDDATLPHDQDSDMYLSKRHKQKNEVSEVQKIGVPIYDVPIDASFLERYRDEQYNPLYYLNIPKLRNCNFGAVVSGSSMYPVMKSGSIAMCRVVEDLEYFDPGEMYFLSTTNGFETVKYVQPGDKPDELLLIPHNEKIKPRTIHKSMVLKMCIVEAWINFR